MTVLFSLKNAVVRFAFEVGFQGIVAGKSYSPVIAHTEALRWAKIDWD